MITGTEIDKSNAIDLLNARHEPVHVERGAHQRPRFTRQSRPPEWPGNVIVALVILATLYVLVALGRHALMRPELTDTQRGLRIVDALLWR